jgi:hypothetical protein
MNITEGFFAFNENLRVYNGKAIINLVVPFYEEDLETPFSFSDDIGSYYFKVYDERLGHTIKNFSSQVSRSDNNLIMNLSVADMTFDDNGKYYYEIGYIRSGGYDELLRYGVLIVL